MKPAPSVIERSLLARLCISAISSGMLICLLSSALFVPAVAQIEVVNGGNVGIGTTNPASQLHLYNGNPGTLSPYYGGQIRADSAANSGVLLSTPTANAAYIYHNTPLDGASAGIKFDGAARYMSFFTVNGSERLRIDNNGNVGIGTTSPAAKLDIQSSGSPALRIFDGASDTGTMDFRRTSDGWHMGQIKMAHAGNYGANLSIRLHPNDGAQPTVPVEVMTVYAAGNVGIGTTNPAYKLDVNGTVNTSLARAGYFLGNGPLAAYDSASGGLYLGFTNGGSYVRSVADNSGNAASMVLQIGNGNDAITISAARAIRFNAYGAGSLSTDSSGNITATSDARAKDTVGDFTTGLAAVRRLQPRKYHWKASTGLNTADLNVSVYAQDLIAAGVPEAVFPQTKPAESGQPVTEREPSVYTVNDRAVISVLINAAKELSNQNDALEVRLAALESRLKELEKPRK